MTPAEQAARLRAESPVELSASLPTPDRVWPERAWAAFVRAGIPRWTIPAGYEGQAASAAELLSGCFELARMELVPVFVLSQFQAACQRIAASVHEAPKQAWLPALARGEKFATVGISHLTTSRQHAGQPAVAAWPDGRGGYRVTGEIPWVTGSGHADVLVGGATLDDGRQMLFALPMTRSGVEVAPPLPLVALEGSETGPVRLVDVEVREEELLTAIVPKVLQQGTSGAGSLTTSALAAGHAQGCVDRIAREAEGRPVLQEIVAAFQEDVDSVLTRLIEGAGGASSPEHSAEVLRTDATALALKASQALMTASKGAGFVTGHPAERLAREALFFLVWSCPQAVSSKLLREFSQCDQGIAPDLGGVA